MTELFKYISALPEFTKALIVLAVIIIAFFVIKAISGKKNKAEGDTTEEIGTVKGEAAPAFAHTLRAGGTTTLIDTDEKTAAVIMAIVSNRLSIPLERLHFESIRCMPLELYGVSDSEAAVIMAITSHMTGKPLENLSFNSIKLISE